MVEKKDAGQEADERKAIIAAFDDAVNMTPAAIEHWLQTEESRSVGMTPEGKSEAVGHASGRKIVAIKRKKQADLTKADLLHMKKVAGYVARHLAQGGPEEDVETSRWRYSLMNWGHDPLKH